MMQIQEWIYKLEVGEGTRIVRLAAAVLGMLALTAIYDVREYKNFSTTEAMDTAQLARNVAEGKGYTTHFIRPFSLYLVQERQSRIKARTSDFTLVKTGHPDLANPPVYPMILAGVMKVLPFDYAIGNPKSFLRYQPEVLIAFLNQALFFVAVVMVFRLARRLFDASVAWISTLVLAGSDLFWRFSVSGLSTMLLLIIFLTLVWCLVVMEEAVRGATRKGVWFAVMAVLVGAAVGTGALTRYSFGWLLLPVLAFLGMFFGRRRWLVCLLCLVTFLGVLTPWLVRNHAASGALFGTAGYAILQDTPQFPADRLGRSLHPNLDDVPLEDYLRKLVVNLGEIVQNDLPRLGGSWVTALFLAGLMVPFMNVGLSRLRAFLLMALGVLAVVQALGRTHLSADSPEVNSENLLVVLAPLVFVFGVAMYSLLLENLNLEFPPMRVLITTLFLLVVCAPLIFTLLPPRRFPLAYPPYYPPLIQRFATWMRDKELVMSDVPWAVAWYGRCQSVWTTLRVQDPKGRDDFYAINDLQKPVSGLYLTQVTMDARFYSQMLRGEDWAWGRFLMDSLLRTNIPPGFPLKHAPPDYLENGQIFLTDWPRWRTRAQQ